MNIYQYILQSISKREKLLAILLDPDKVNLDEVSKFTQKINNKADFIFVGGSTVSNGDTENLVEKLKENTKLPIVLFPGDYTQITNKADTLLFLSLISGENPEYLIKQQLKSVPFLEKSSLEIISTGYILINGGVETSVQKVSNTRPIDQLNIELISRTAIAGMYMGKQLIYLEAGSGATEAVSQIIIKEVSKNISIPLIVGGGIRTRKQLDDAFNAGADLVVIGTAFEENNQLFDRF
ncbi:MAG: geranylgeranylglyceryl/heptaprenylglyceryl phosphate synthase [Flavobacteriaceae bacterium]|nr:geranylgeranylglyceryl/heptaprenylglyceryl phosphate synthase [Flavobacteriaceae bacterium]